LGVKESTASIIVKEDLALHLYKIQFSQQLSLRNKQERKELAEALCDELDRKKIRLSSIIMSGETHFHLDDYLNKQEYRLWGLSRPDDATERPLLRKKRPFW